MVCVEGCWVANVNKLMFVLSGCCPGDIIRPRTIFIFLISSQSTDYRFHFIISLRPAIVCWSPHLLRAGPGLWNVIWEGNGSDWQCIDWLGGWGVGRAGGTPRMGPNVSCGLEFSRQPAPAPAHCPRTIRWFLIPFNWARWRWTAGRGATGWDNPAQPSRSHQTHSQIPSIHQHWLANMQCGLELETKVKRRFAKG